MRFAFEFLRFYVALDLPGCLEPKFVFPAVRTSGPLPQVVGPIPDHGRRIHLHRIASGLIRESTRHRFRTLVRAAKPRVPNVFSTLFLKLGIAGELSHELLDTTSPFHDVAAHWFSRSARLISPADAVASFASTETSWRSGAKGLSFAEAPSAPGTARVGSSRIVEGLRFNSLSVLLDMIVSSQFHKRGWRRRFHELGSTWRSGPDNCESIEDRTVSQLRKWLAWCAVFGGDQVAGRINRFAFLALFFLLGGVLSAYASR